jgi:hypothetical protein
MQCWERHWIPLLTKGKNIMKKLLLILAAGFMAVIFTSCTTPRQSNEVTMTGMMVCGKCKLHMTKECQNVLQVQQDGQTVNYFLVMNEVSTDFHDNICKNDGEKTTVTGTVEEKDGQEMLTPTKIVPVADSN